MNRRSKYVNEKGFTLVEMVMVIVILGVIGAFTFQFVAHAVQAFKKSSARKDLYDQGRLALERMVRELRDAKEVTGSGGSSITFKKAHPAQAADNTEEIKFELNGTNLERVGDPSGTPATAVLAANVSSFTVSGAGGGGGGAGSSFGVDNVSYGTTAADNAPTMTVSHTTGSGSNRLMLVGVSFDNTDYETVTQITYNGTALQNVGARSHNNGDDARHEIWKLVNPDSGTHDVVITFDPSEPLDNGAVAGVMTFTCVDQTTPLGSYAYAEGTDNTGGTLNVSSAPGELVYAIASAEYYALTASSGQDEHWNISHSGADTNGAGGTDAGASPTVPMSWSLSAGHNYWTIGGVSIKPAAAGCAGNLVMVTGSGDFSGGDDNNKKTLFESWGWTVTAIDDGDPQATFDNAAANNDVMYISEEVGSGTVGVKTRDLSIPIVDEENYHWDEMGFTTGGSTNEDSTATSLTIQDNSHYITSPFSTGSLTIYSPSGDLGYYTIGDLASGITELATRTSGEPCLFVAETGAQLNGLTAPARRVGFFTCYSSFANWHSNTKTLLQRALDWALGNDQTGNLVTLEITLTDPNDSGNTVTMRTKVYMRNLPPT